MSSVFIFLTLTLANLCQAQIKSKSGEFNLTSPLEDGVYVAGQQLPITYIILDSGSRLNLNIYFQPAPGVNSTGTIIAQNADVSEVAGAVVIINGRSYWQHTYNYNLPPNVPQGNFFVIFESVNTNINTSVPVIIRPYVNMTTTIASSSIPASMASPTASSNTHKSMAIYLQPVLSLLLAAISISLYSLVHY
ncbi:unnamed protein product [Absidia cylindrospora]